MRGPIIVITLLGFLFIPGFTEAQTLEELLYKHLKTLEYMKQTIEKEIQQNDALYHKAMDIVARARASGNQEAERIAQQAADKAWQNKRKNEKLKADVDNAIAKTLYMLNKLKEVRENVKTQPALKTQTSDLNEIIGIVLKSYLEHLGDTLPEDIGEKFVEDLDKKYGKDWGEKGFKHALGILRVTVAFKEEKAPGGIAATIDYLISLIPIPNIQMKTFDFGKRVVVGVNKWALDKVLSETENFCEFNGLACSKEEFERNAYSDMNTSQKALLKWLGWGE